MFFCAGELWWWLGVLIDAKILKDFFREYLEENKLIKYADFVEKTAFPLLLICFVILLINFHNISENYRNIINLLNVCVANN